MKQTYFSLVYIYFSGVKRKNDDGIDVSEESEESEEDDEEDLEVENQPQKKKKISSKKADSNEKKLEKELDQHCCMQFIMSKVAEHTTQYPTNRHKILKDQKAILRARPCPFIQIASKFYLDKIRIKPG